jgi:hypothetical protein
LVLIRNLFEPAPPSHRVRIPSPEVLKLHNPLERLYLYASRIRCQGSVHGR